MHLRDSLLCYGLKGAHVFSLLCSLAWSAVPNGDFETSKGRGHRAYWRYRISAGASAGVVTDGQEHNVFHGSRRIAHDCARSDGNWRDVPVSDS